MSTVKRAIERAASRLERATRRWPATLSTATGDIAPGYSARVPSVPGQVYVVMPDGAVITAYNSRVPSDTGRRVYVGYEPHNPSLLRVLDFQASYNNPSPAGGFGAHAPTHVWPASDTVYSQARQLMPLRLRIVSGFIVGVEPSPYWTGTGWALTPVPTLDLEPDVPASGRRYVFVYVDTDGALASRAGVASPGALVYNQIPPAYPGETPLGAVALYAGQTGLQETLAVQDIVDLRFAGFAAAGGGESATGWFSPSDYGAAGDGVANDTTAISDAIAALTAAGGGVLYFPAGRYLATTGFTLSVNATVLGSGMASAYGHDGISQIEFDNSTDALFTISALKAQFQDLSLVNVSASTPSAGSTAVLVDGTDIAQAADLQRCSVYGFYNNVTQNGAQWVIRDCFILGPINDGILVNNTVYSDAGDWTIDRNVFGSDERDSYAAIRIEGSGGGKISNNKSYDGWNVGGFKSQFAVDVALISGTGITSILLITNNSFEYMSNTAIRINSFTFQYNLISIHGNQFSSPETDAQLIVVNAVTLGDIQNLIISANNFSGPTNDYAISLTNVNNAWVNANLLLGANFAGLLTTTGCTNIFQDGVGTVTSVDLTVPAEFAVAGAPITGAGTLAVTAVAQSPNLFYAGPAAGAAAAPGFRALATADLGTGADGTRFLRDDLTWQAVASGGAGELLMQDGVGSPPVPLETEDGFDWIYGDA